MATLSNLIASTNATIAALSEERIPQSLLIYRACLAIIDGAISGGGGGLTQSQAQQAIEEALTDSTEIDSIVADLASLDGKIGTTDLATVITRLTEVRDSLRDFREFEGFFVTAGDSNVYERRTTIDSDTGVATVTWFNLDGTSVATPAGPYSTATGAATGNMLAADDYEGTGAGAIADGAIVTRLRLLDQSGALIATTWVDFAGTTITAPAAGDVRPATGRVDELIATLDAVVDAIALDIAAIATSVANIEGEVDAIQGDVADIETALGTISVNIADSENLLTNIDVTATAMATDVSDIETLLTTVSTNVADVETLLTTIEGDTGAIQTATEAIEDSIGLATDTAATVGGAGTLQAKSRLITTQLDNLENAVKSSQPITYKEVSTGRIGQGWLVFSGSETSPEQIVVDAAGAVVAPAARTAIHPYDKNGLTRSPRHIRLTGVTAAAIQIVGNFASDRLLKFSKVTYVNSGLTAASVTHFLGLVTTATATPPVAGATFLAEPFLFKSLASGSPDIDLENSQPFTLTTPNYLWLVRSTTPVDYQPATFVANSAPSGDVYYLLED